MNNPTAEMPTSPALQLASTPPAALSNWRTIAPIGTGVFLVMLPVTMMVPVLKEIVADRFSASTFWTHSFMSINMLGAILAAPLGAMLCDRLGKRRPIIIVAFLADSLLLWMMGMVQTLPALLVVRFCEGMAHIVALTSLMALAWDWAGPGHRGRMMGVIGTCLMFGTAIGSPLGGAIGRSSPNFVFTVGALIALFAGVLAILAVRDTNLGRGKASLAKVRDLLRSRRNLLIPFAYAFIDRFCVGVLITTFMLQMSSVLSLAPQERGMMIAFFMLPFAMLCYPVGRIVDRFGRVWPMAAGSLAFGVVFATYGLWSAQWLPMVMVLSGVLSATMFSPNLALCADLAPANQSAMAFAGFNVAGSLGFLCGPLFAGVLCSMLLPSLGEAAGYRIVLAAAGGTEVLCAVVTLPLLLSLRKSGQIK